MIKKKNKFFTFILSLIPGVGQMYMGLMKQGLSIMALLTLIIFLSNFFYIDIFLYTIPLLWFYSFFDCMNKASLSDEVFATLKDNYLFSFDTFIENKNKFIRQYKFIIALLLILAGFKLLFRNILSMINGYTGIYIDIQLFNFLSQLDYYVPQLIIGLLVICIGIKLILGKKKELVSKEV